MGRILDRLLKHPVFSLALACASLFYLPLGLRALWDPGESRTAEIAREMLEWKDWLAPHLNYVLYFNKPPLMYWLTALSMRWAGITPMAARLACATFGLLTVIVTYRWGSNWKNERVGLLAGGILATSLGFFAFTQYATSDMALTFWTTLALLAGSGLLVERAATRARGLTYTLAVGLAGGVLTQGLSALVLPCVALLAVYISQGRRVPIVKRPWKAAAILGAVLTLPWFIAISLQHPIFPYYFLVQQYLPRYGAGVPMRPVYFYVPIILAGFLPWAVFLPRIAATWFSNRHAALQRDPEGAVMVAWACLIFLFYTLSPTKLIGSILPVFPALALLLASEFDEVLESSETASEEPMPAWIGHGLATMIFLLFGALLMLKCPAPWLTMAHPEWKAVVDQSGSLSLALGFGVFVLVGVWGMRQTLTCVGGVMLVQVLLLTSAASIAPALDAYYSAHIGVERMRAHASENVPLVMYGQSNQVFPYSLLFYIGRRAVILGSAGELQLGQEQDVADTSWWVPEESSAQALEAMPAGSWGVTDAEHWQTLRQTSPDVYQPVSQVGHGLLFKKEQ